MTVLLSSVAASFAIACLATPLFRRIATKYHVFARHNHRTVHEGNIPKLGGAAIFVAILATTVGLMALQPELLAPHLRQLLGLLIGGTVLFALGTCDDIWELDCNLKLSFQVLAAVVLVHSGFRIDSLALPRIGTVELGILSYPLTVLWVVGITNAVNLIDGLDGLAAGIGLAVTGVTIGLALTFGDPLTALLAATLAGALLGFLPYNMNPARIFLGDSGSLFLGFLLSWLSIRGATLAPGQVAIVTPLIVLGLPVLDTTMAIVRRLRRGIHPFKADREHIHHRLLYAGLSHRKASLLMCSVSLFLACVAYLIGHNTLTATGFEWWANLLP